MSTLLFFGDIVGEPGRKALYKILPRLREEYGAIAAIANAENAAGGRGITQRIANELFRAGIDAITLGDHAWDQADLINWIADEPRLVRPYNLVEGTPGQGYTIIPTIDGPLGILALQGRTFMRPCSENPFTHGAKAVQKLRAAGCHNIVVDMHAETTSEKVAMGHHLDGSVSAVLGTHTHVQTADACILPKGSSYITDVGMCGPHHSVIGREVEAVVSSFTSALLQRFPVASWPAHISGVAVDIDMKSGLANTITSFNHLVEKHNGR